MMRTLEPSVPGISNDGRLAELLAARPKKVEAEEEEREGFVEATINLAEAALGVDLDGDGDIGVAGHDNRPSLADLPPGQPALPPPDPALSAGGHAEPTREVAEQARGSGVDAAGTAVLDIDSTNQHFFRAHFFNAPVSALTNEKCPSSTRMLAGR